MPYSSTVSSNKFKAHSSILWISCILCSCGYNSHLQIFIICFIVSRPYQQFINTWTLKLHTVYYISIDVHAFDADTSFLDIEWRTQHGRISYNITGHPSVCRPHTLTSVQFFLRLVTGLAFQDSSECNYSYNLISAKHCCYYLCHLVASLAPSHSNDILLTRC